MRLILRVFLLHGEIIDNSVETIRQDSFSRLSATKLKRVVKIMTVRKEFFFHLRPTVPCAQILHKENSSKINVKKTYQTISDAGAACRQNCGRAVTPGNNIAYLKTRLILLH